MRRWGLSLVCVLLAAMSAGTVPLMAAVFLVLAVLVSPRAFPRSVTDAEARRRSTADGRPIVYWRPGCPFCMRLRARLGRRAERLHWVDIWADPAGAASVRAVAGGNETVPTVVHAGAAHVNPAPAEVLSMVRDG